MHVLPRRTIASSFTMAALLLGVTANAADREFDGYSYATIGAERLGYEEHPSLLPAHTHTTVSNIALKSGGLFAINNQLDFSLDTSTTLVSNPATEVWSLNGGSDGAAYRAQYQLPSPSDTLQTDRFRLSASNVQLLLHYKHSDSFRSVYGVDFDTSSFKRYDWATVQSPVIALPSGAVEEETNSLYATFGLAYESAGLARERSRLSVRALAQLPLWRQTTNTALPDATFSSTRGFAAQLSAGWSYRLYAGIEAGLYASYGYRLQGKDEIVTATYRAEVPKNTVTSSFIGLQFAWNLSRKE